MIFQNKSDKKNNTSDKISNMSQKPHHEFTKLFISSIENDLSIFEAWYNSATVFILEKIHEHKEKNNKKSVMLWHIPLKTLSLVPLSLRHHFNIFSFLKKASLKINTFYKSKFFGHLKKLAPVGGALSVLITGVFVTYTIYNVSSYDIEITAFADGKQIGIVSSKETVDSAVSKLESVISGQTDTKYSYSKAISYDFARVKNSDVQSDEEVYQLLYNDVISNYSEAYGLFIDGSLAGAAKTDSELNNVVCTLEESIKASLDENEDIQIVNDIEIKKLFFLNSQIKSENAILSSMSNSFCLQYESINEAILSIDYENDLTLAPNASDGSSRYINEDVDFGLSRSVADDTVSGNNSVVENSINYEVIRQETVAEVIPPETIVESSDSLYKGTYKTKQYGTSGEKLVTYEVRYINEVETSRKAISEEITIDKTDTIILKGTLAKPKTASTGVFVYPISGYKITDRFGSRIYKGSSEMHRGVDFAASKGTHIYASDGGVVIEAGYSSSYGNCVKIKHDNGYVTLYAHQSKLAVSEGDKVYQGQLIGYVGKTGKATGYHLHFEIRKGSKYFDPLNYLQ